MREILKFAYKFIRKSHWFYLWLIHSCKFFFYLTKNVIIWSSSKTTDFSLVTYTRFLQSFISWKQICLHSIKKQLYSFHFEVCYNEKRSAATSVTSQPMFPLICFLLSKMFLYWADISATWAKQFLIPEQKKYHFYSAVTYQEILLKIYFLSHTKQFNS